MRHAHVKRASPCRIPSSSFLTVGQLRAKRLELLLPLLVFTVFSTTAILVLVITAASHIFPVLRVIWPQGKKLVLNSFKPTLLLADRKYHSSVPSLLTSLRLSPLARKSMRCGLPLASTPQPERRHRHQHHPRMKRVSLPPYMMSRLIGTRSCRRNVQRVPWRQCVRHQRWHSLSVLHAQRRA